MFLGINWVPFVSQIWRPVLLGVEKKVNGVSLGLSKVERDRKVFFDSWLVNPTR